MFEEITDELLQARLEQLKVREPQQQCANRHRVDRICINPECKDAILCGKPDCDKCAYAHEACPMVSLSGLSSMLNERVSVFHDFAVQMLQI
jgi:hypothetical protein